MIEVKEVDGFKLVCLRNPWGSFEWKVCVRRRELIALELNEPPL